VARWRNRLDLPGIPDWVRTAWVYGDDEARELAGLWHDDLYGRDPVAWEAALMWFLATPSYS
jgi:hypothetical protein